MASRPRPLALRVLMPALLALSGALACSLLARGEPDGKQRKLDPETVRQLKELGYL